LVLLRSLQVVWVYRVSSLNLSAWGRGETAFVSRKATKEIRCGECTFSCALKCGCDDSVGSLRTTGDFDSTMICLANRARPPEMVHRFRSVLHRGRRGSDLLLDSTATVKMLGAKGSRRESGVRFVRRDGTSRSIPHSSRAWVQRWLAHHPEGSKVRFPRGAWGATAPKGLRRGC